MVILLPAIWLIASLVFFLSKNIPGNAADYRFEDAGQEPNQTVKAEIRRKAYRQYLQRTGQNLPLFYVSLATAAEPDTLYKIWPETDRIALKKLLSRYGNWKAVSDYYHSISGLQKQIYRTGIIHEISGILLIHPDSVIVHSQLELLRKNALRLQDTTLQKAISRVENSYHKLVGCRPGFKSYVPVIKWQGINSQYHKWLAQVLHGNLGYSSRDSQPVLQVVGKAFKLTLVIAFITLLLVSSFAVLTGMFLAGKKSLLLKTAVSGALYLTDALPLFVIALLLLLFSGGDFMVSEEMELYNVAPVILCLTLANLPYLTGQFQAALQQVLKQEYILAARAKGLSAGKVLWQHAFRNALLPVITVISDFFPGLLVGTVVLEVIFSLPGMGRLLAEAVLARDYNVIIGVVLFTGSLKIISHLLADLAYAIADPRIRA